MGKRVQLQPHLSLAQLREQAAAATVNGDQRLCQRWQVILAIAADQTTEAVAAETGLCLDWVRKLVRRYNRCGAAAMADGRRTNQGQQPVLDEAQVARLQAELAGPAPDGGPWNGPRVAAWISVEVGRPVDAKRGWVYLRRLGYQPHRVTSGPALQAALPTSVPFSRTAVRGSISQPRPAYPSDLSDAEWAVLAPLVSTPHPRGGRPERWSKREILNGIFYNLRSGQAWRMLPHDLPPWKTVYHWWRVWRRDGTWERLHQLLREEVRRQAGREPEPSAGILDSQSVKTGEKGGRAATTAARRSRGANATS